MFLYSIGSVFILTIVSVNFAAIPENNACKNFEDYFNWTVNKNCFYNPDMTLETPSLLKKYVGKYETYRVISEDGYILKMFRIPKNNPKGVIFLHHALGVDSRVWVGQGNSSLAFYLSKAGYDVWMNNNRGTLFSQKHQSLSSTDVRYWDFSFHEVGYYDIPSEVELIKRKTNNSKIIYIGYSFGSTSGLIYGSLRAEEAKNSMKAFVFMATPCLFKYNTNIISMFTPLQFFIQPAIDNLGFGNALFFLPIRQILKIVCKISPFFLLVVHVLTLIIAGNTPEETDATIFNFDSGIYLKGLSWKSLTHYLQLFATQTRFQMFDYGKEKNLIKYGSETAPSYPIENFSVPILFISGEGDTLTTLKDTDLLLDMLPKEVKTYGHLKVPSLNHVQYVTGKDAKEFYSKKLLHFLDSISVLKK